jgi:hypothetical protein
MFPFTNPWMLVALAAVAIPLIIEWLFRRRKRQVELPTIRFLLNNKEQEKIRRQDRILLIMRSLAIFLLVMALARPIVQRGLLGGHKDRKILLVIDTTASMNQNVSYGTSFSLAQAKAAALVRNLPKEGVTLGVCTVGAQADTVVEPTNDLDLASRAISGLECSRGSGAIGDGLDWAAKTIEDRKWGKAEVYVFSDFQQQTWKPAQHPEQVGNALSRLKEKSELFLVDVGGGATAVMCKKCGFKPPMGVIPSECPKCKSRDLEYFTWNLTLTGLSPKVPQLMRSKRVITTERPVQFIVELGSVGKIRPGSQALVSLYVDEGHVATQTVDVSTSSTVIFDHVFAQAGEHLVKAVISQGDDFELDNERLYLCSVPNSYQVLVLDDRITPDADNITDSYYLLKAITPTPEVKSGKHTDFSVRAISTPMLADEENLRSYSVIIMTATRMLTPEMAAKLEQWVRDGGGLIIFGGPDISQYDYNRLLFNDNDPAQSLLPAKLRASTQPDKEVLPKFGDMSMSGLTNSPPDPDAGVMQYLQVATPPKETETLLRLSDGSPLVLRKSLGDGKVVLCTTTAGHDWTYMASVPAFSMLFQELLIDLVGDPDKAVNLSTGGVFRQPVYVTTDEILFQCPDGKSRTARPQAPSRAAAGASARPPTSQSDVDAAAAEAAGQRYVMFTETDAPGLYAVDEQIQQVVPRAKFVVNSDSAEADLSRVSEDEFRKTYPSAAGRWVQRDEAVETIAATLHAVWELFPAFLWGLAALMAGESLLAWRFGRRRGEVTA